VFPNAAGRLADQPGGAVPTEYGIHVDALTPDRAHKVGLEGQKGVLVTEIDPASFGDDLGFGQGDVISEVNRESVSSVDEYRKVISKLKPGDNVVFKVLRRQDDKVLTVYLPGVVPSESTQ
jgi:serine protease Do